MRNEKKMKNCAKSHFFFENLILKTRIVTKRQRSILRAAFRIRRRFDVPRSTPLRRRFVPRSTLRRSAFDAASTPLRRSAFDAASTFRVRRRFDVPRSTPLLENMGDTEKQANNVLQHSQEQSSVEEAGAKVVAEDGVKAGVQADFQDAAGSQDVSQDVLSNGMSGATIQTEMDGGTLQTDMLGVLMKCAQAQFKVGDGFGIDQNIAMYDTLCHSFQSITNASAGMTKTNAQMLVELCTSMLEGCDATEDENSKQNLKPFKMIMLDSLSSLKSVLIEHKNKIPMMKDDLKKIDQALKENDIGDDIGDGIKSSTKNVTRIISNLAGTQHCMKIFKNSIHRIASLIVFLMKQARAPGVSSGASSAASYIDPATSVADFDEHRKTILDMCDVLSMNAAHQQTSAGFANMAMNALVSKMSLAAKMEIERGIQKENKQKLTTDATKQLEELNEKFKSLEAKELKQRLESEERIKKIQDELASVKQLLATEKQEVQTLKRKRQEEDNVHGTKMSKMQSLLHQNQQLMKEMAEAAMPDHEHSCSKNNDEIKSALDSHAVTQTVPQAVS